MSQGKSVCLRKEVVREREGETEDREAGEKKKEKENTSELVKVRKKWSARPAERDSSSEKGSHH